MKPELFLEKIKDRNSISVSKLSYFGLTWQQWAKFTKMTKDIDYGCNFGRNGKTCSRNRYYGGAEEKCCCEACGLYIGYLKFIPDNKTAIKKIASLFDEKRGFWRSRKGCILPIEYRSNVCVAYKCEEAKVHTKVKSPRDPLVQMILYFLDAIRAYRLSESQIRSIIKALNSSILEFYG